jgi:hypothetical protein
MKGRSALAIALLCMAAAHTGGAQEAPPAEATAAPSQATDLGGGGTSGSGAISGGTITGTVYCADTDLPARLATINLIESAENGFAISDTTRPEWSIYVQPRAGGQLLRSGSFAGLREPDERDDEIAPGCDDG